MCEALLSFSFFSFPFYFLSFPFMHRLIDDRSTSDRRNLRWFDD